MASGTGPTSTYLCTSNFRSATTAVRIWDVASEIDGVCHTCKQPWVNLATTPPLSFKLTCIAWWNGHGVRSLVRLALQVLMIAQVLDVSLCDHTNVHVRSGAQVVVYTSPALDMGAVHTECLVVSHYSLSAATKTLDSPRQIHLMARVTNSTASSRSMPSRYPLSNTDMALSDPEPMVQYGRESVDPWG